MAIQLEPVELNIEDAINSVDKLADHIENAFKKHGASDDPRIERLLQQLRGVYDTLLDVQERMDNMNFNPAAESQLDAVRNHITGLNTDIESTTTRLSELTSLMQSASFNPNLNAELAQTQSEIQEVINAIRESQTNIQSMQNTIQSLQDIGVNPNARAELAEITDEIQKTASESKNLKGIMEDASTTLATTFAMDINEIKATGEIISAVGSKYEEIKALAAQNDGSEASVAAQQYLKYEDVLIATREKLSELQNEAKIVAQQVGLSDRIDAEKARIEEERNGIRALTDDLINLSRVESQQKAQARSQGEITQEYDMRTQALQNYTAQVENLRQEEQALQNQVNQQNALADEYQRASESATVLQQRLNQLAPPIQKTNSLLLGMQHILQSAQAVLRSLVSAVKWVFSKIGALAKEIASKIKSAMSSLLSHVKSIANRIGKALSSKFGSLGKSASGLTNTLEGGFKKALRTLLKYGLGVRSLFFLFRKLRSAATESLGEMAKQIPEVNKQMSSLKQSMNQMKGSLSTMVQPILNILVPVLTKVAAIVTSITEKIASFFALLTGQNYIVSATAGAVDYAASLDKTGKSAKKAKKELEGYLSPIDEINKYQDKNKDEDDKDSGADAGGGGLTFKKKPISDAMKDFFDWIKKMWEKGDFYELGKMLGDKLAKALASIPWDKIKKVARKLGSSLATLINGFIAGEFDGKSVSWWIGHTLAESINTAFEFLNEFVHKLDWRGIGKAIADFFNGAFGSIDWKLIRDTWVTGLHGISDTINEFIDNFDWDSISTTISNLVNILTEGLVDFFTNTNFAELGANLGEQFRKTIEEIEWADVGRTLGLIFKDIFDFAINFLQQQSWESVRTAIHDLIQGFLEGLGLDDAQVDGIMSWVDKIGGWLDKLVAYISNVDWQGVWDTIVDTVTTVWNTISDIWTALQPVLEDIWKALQPLLEDLGKRLKTFLDELPEKLEKLRESEEFKSFLDWLSNLKWEDIKNGLTDLGNALKTVAEVVLGFKAVAVGVNVISTLTTAIKGLTKVGGGIGTVVKGLKDLKGAKAMTDTIEVMDFDAEGNLIGKGVTKSIGERIGEGAKTLGTKISGMIKNAATAAKPALANAGAYMSQVLLGDIGANLSAGGAVAGGTIAVGLVGSVVAAIGGLEAGKKIGSALFPDDADLYESYSGIKGSWEMLKDTGKGVADLISMKWDDMKKKYRESTDSIKTDTDAIQPEIHKMGIVSDETSQRVVEAFQSLKDKAAEHLGTFKTDVKEKFENTKQNIKEFKTSASDKFNEFRDKLHEFKENAITKLTELRDGMKEKWDTAKQHLEEFKTAIIEKWEFIKGKVAEFKENVVTKIEEFKTTLGEKWDAIKEKVEEFKNAFHEKLTAFTEKVDEFKKNVHDKFEEIKKNFTDVFEQIKEGIKSPINGILGFVESFINKLIDAFNGLGDKLGSIDIDIPDWVPEFGGKEFKIGMPKLNHVSVPRLAQGAVIPPNQEFMAVLGDQKKGTNIETPLATMVEAFNQALAMNGGGNGGNITLNLMLPDKRTIAQYAIEGGQVLQMSRGYNPFLLERG